MSEAALTDRVDAQVTGWTADESPRQVFSPEDEEVTLKIRFDLNYRAVYEWYKVEWIAPDGSPYKVVTLRTDFGSHRDLKASLQIRGKMASRMPGVWRVRIWLRGREGAPDTLLVARLFRIREPSAELLASGLTPVDAPSAQQERPLAGPHSATALEPAKPGQATSEPAPPPTVALPTGLLPPAGIAPGPASTTGAPVAARAVPGASPSAAAPVAPDAAGLPSGQRAGVPQATAGGIAAITLEASPGPPLTPRRVRRDYPGCPPLYYPPGPDCVEQSPYE